MRARRAAARRHRVAHSSVTSFSAQYQNTPGGGGALRSPGAFDPMPLRLTLIALVLGVVTMCGCQQGTAFQSEPQRPHAAANLVARVSLGRTTASDIERQFGTADERAPDGSLVYRFETVRSRGGRTRTQNETITLRFAGGVLSKICRTRS